MHHLYVSEERDAEHGETTTDIQQILNHPPLKDKVNRFLQILLEGGSVRYAAGQVNVSYKTALAWLSVPELQAYAERIEQAIQETSTTQLERAAGVAVDTLVHIMLQEQNCTGVNHDTHVTVKACKALLDHYNLQQQNDVLRQQVRELERQLEEKDRDPGEQPPLRIVM